MYKKVYHLSHIDLDGYSCQLITEKIFNNIEFYNSNYGLEIDERLEEIVLKANDGDLVVITDINLDEKQLKYIDEKSKEQGFELLLLDHHKTSEDMAKKYDWYILDISKSATKITYDYFLKENDINYMQEYIDAVNAFDIWLVDQEKNFEIGKVLARYVSTAKEINRIMFSKDSFKYIEYLLKKAMQIVKETQANIKLDDMLHSTKKSFFRNEKDNTLENLVSDYVVELLTKNKDNMTVYFEDKKGILTYSVGNTSIIGNGFLRANPDYYFFLDVNSRKNISLRADNRCDVSEIAKKLFKGGGHANASGGRFEEFKDSFVYEKIKKQFDDYFNSEI